MDNFSNIDQLEIAVQKLEASWARYNNTVSGKELEFKNMLKKIRAEEMEILKRDTGCANLFDVEDKLKELRKLLKRCGSIK